MAADPYRALGASSPLPKQVLHALSKDPPELSDLCDGCASQESCQVAVVALRPALARRHHVGSLRLVMEGHHLVRALNVHSVLMEETRVARVACKDPLSIYHYELERMLRSCVCGHRKGLPEEVVVLRLAERVCEQVTEFIIVLPQVEHLGPRQLLSVVLVDLLGLVEGAAVVSNREGAYVRVRPSSAAGGYPGVGGRQVALGGGAAGLLGATICRSVLVAERVAKICGLGQSPCAGGPGYPSVPVEGELSGRWEGQSHPPVRRRLLGARGRRTCTDARGEHSGSMLYGGTDWCR
mmetsp:Transcript_33763/g.95531  ORF Transcript_33763/g.95531 Transcript_33763/m.95531 type:complete len:295 (-) Transcript_33763:285-1169(-)